MPKLGDRLSAARRRQFVGRSSELALFQSALDADELPFQIMFVYGPGGVGKTTLLDEFARRCAEAQTSVSQIDARTLDPTPESLIDALRRLLNLAPTESPFNALNADTRRRVILVDTFELLSPLDTWLRETFLPQLSENVLVVFAGREPPSVAWLADAGWQAFIRHVPLRNLSPDESRTYLRQRSVPDEQHPAVLGFTHGFPLALSLVAEVFAQRPDTLRGFQPEAAPDIVKSAAGTLRAKSTQPRSPRGAGSLRPGARNH